MPDPLAPSGDALPLTTARRIWYARQGLAAPSKLGAAEMISATGWLRTFGGNAYVSARARLAGFHRQDLDAAVFTFESILNVPSVRGCVMLVPREEAGASLGAAVGQVERDTSRVAERCGVAISEVDALGETILGTLDADALTADELRRALPAGAVRDLGEVGKKLGDSSTLSLALKRLAARGRIQRLPVDDRLDNNRLRYRPIQAAIDLDGGPDGDADALPNSLVTAFLRWAAPATVDEISQWSSLGKRRVQASLEALGATALRISHVEVDQHSMSSRANGLGSGAAGSEALANGAKAQSAQSDLVEAWTFAGDRLMNGPMTTVASPFAFLPIDDNLFGFRGTFAHLVPASHHAQLVDGKPLGKAWWAPLHTIVEDGMAIGFWEWHPVQQAIVWRTLGPVPGWAQTALQAEAEALGAFVRDELGDLRMSSLDNQKDQLRRVGVMEAIGVADG